MPSSQFSSDYLTLVLTATTENETLARMFNLFNEFPEGSARRLELEADFLENLASHIRKLATLIRENNKVTLYDKD